MVWRHWWDELPEPSRKWWKDTKYPTGSTTNALCSSALKWRHSLTPYQVSALKRPNGAWKSAWGGGRDDGTTHARQQERARLRETLSAALDGASVVKEE